MNPLDIVIAVIVGFCLVRGLFRGLIKEISSLVGVAAGFVAAMTYYPLAAKLLAGFIHDKAYLNITGFLAIFILVLLLVGLIGMVIKYLMNVAHLGWTDRICGLVFGLLKGALIASVLLLVLTSFLNSGTPVIKDSHLAPYVTVVSENLAKVVPKDLKSQFSKKMTALKKAWKPS